MQFLIGDKFEINIPILNEIGLLLLTNVKQKYLNEENKIIPTFKWKSLQIKDCEENDNIENINSPDLLGINYDRRKTNEMYEIDMSRYCEIEVMKNYWTNLHVKDPKMDAFKVIQKTFEPYFVVKNVYCDDIGFIIYKVVLIASFKGKLNSSKFENEIFKNETDYDLLTNREKNDNNNFLNDEKVVDVNRNKRTNVNNNVNSILNTPTNTINTVQISENNTNKDGSKTFLNKTSILDNIGINIVISNPNEVVLNEIKKNCLIYDRTNTLNVRIGDILVFYFTKN